MRGIFFKPGTRRGATLLVTFVMMLVLSGLAVAAAIFSRNSLLTGQSQLLDKQAFYIAEAGWQRARQALSIGTWVPAPSPGSSNTETFGAGTYTVTIVHNADNTYTITSNGYVPNASTPAAQRQVVESAVTVSASGTNLSLGETASASSTNGSNIAAKAIDGSPSTYWEANNTGNNEWLSLDYGSATSVTFMKLTEKDNRINTITVEYSSNGSTWTAVPNLSAMESPSKTWQVAFSATSAQYFRVKFTNVDSGKKPNIKEWESYASSTFSQGTSYSTSW